MKKLRDWAVLTAYTIGCGVASSGVSLWSTCDD